MVARPEASIALVATRRHSGQLQPTQQVKVGGQCGDLEGPKPGIIDDQRTIAHGYRRPELAEIAWAAAAR